MMVPPQGFRHAVDLLLKNRTRRVPIEDEELARELLALSGDMKAPPEFAAWVIAEYERVLQRPAPPLLKQVGSTRADAPEPQDLFLIYVPEDRLPVAAPLAVELAKRRVSVAFSEYEVESATDLAAAVARGLSIHRAGAVLITPDFLLRKLAEPPHHRRLKMLGRTTSAIAQAEALVVWLSGFHTESINPRV